MPTVLILAREAEFYRNALAPEFDGVEFLVAGAADEAMALAARAEVLVGYAPQISESLIAAMPRLRWIHALTTGVDNLIASATLDLRVAISNSHGIQGPQMSELAVLMMLSTLRDFPVMQQNQRDARWQQWPQPLLMGRTACIVGLGAIAEALAQRLLAFGMQLTGVSDGRSKMPGFARIYPRNEIHAAAQAADFLIVLAPYSAATHHMIDASILASMRRDAILLNLSRGACVDEDALVRCLDSGAIRAAALDVFATEPLPADSPLWSNPRLTITPHIGGRSDIYPQQVLPGLRANLVAWLSDGADGLPDRIKRSA